VIRRNAYTKELLTAIPPRRCRFTEVPIGEVWQADPLDAYIDAVGNALALPIEEAWKRRSRPTSRLSLRLARLVDEFALPDETEPQCLCSLISHVR